MALEFLRMFKRRPVPSAPQAAPVATLERPITAGGWVTIQEAYYVVAVNGDEATVSVRDPATGEQRHVIYPIKRLKQCFALSASGDAKRVRLALEQPVSIPADNPDP